MKKDKVDFKELADRIFFTKGWKDYINDNRIEFRKEKDFSDIQKAIVLSGKRGKYKLEYELGFMEIYLKDIFKIHHKY